MQMHKWLPAVNKQIHQPLLVAWRGSGRGRVCSLLYILYGGSENYYVIRRHVTLVYSIYPPLFAFQSEHSLEASCLLTLLLWARRWGEHYFVYSGKLFMNVRVPYLNNVLTMKLERFVTMVFDLQHKFVGQKSVENTLDNGFCPTNLCCKSNTIVTNLSSFYLFIFHTYIIIAFLRPFSGF